MIIDINIIKTYQFRTPSKDDIMIISSLKQQKIFWVTLDGATYGSSLQANCRW